MALASLLYSSYSYSDSTDVVYGSTNNAASDGLRWVMTNILPQQAGLVVNGVIYRYTTVKQTEDDLIVYVQNENAQGEGYIFRSVDDWSGLPQNTINKTVLTGGIESSFWGDGSIEWEGVGSVTDASVVYAYQYDPCFDPQSRPDCPGYKEPFDPFSLQQDAVNPLDDDLIQQELDRKASLQDEQQEDLDRKKIAAKKKADSRLEKVLGIVNTSLLAADASAKHAELLAMSLMPVSYVATSIPGGVYEDTVVLKDADIKDNGKALRNNLAQQLLHQQMVDLQYDNKK